MLQAMKEMEACAGHCQMASKKNQYHWEINFSWTKELQNSLVLVIEER